MATRPAPDQTARKGRLRDQHQGVERIAVLTEGALDVAVVGRVLGRGEQRAVEPDPTGLVIYLVLVLLTLRDLDGHVESQPAERLGSALGVGCGHETSLGWARSRLRSASAGDESLAGRWGRVVASQADAGAAVAMVVIVGVIAGLVTGASARWPAPVSTRPGCGHERAVHPALGGLEPRPAARVADSASTPARPRRRHLPRAVLARGTTPASTGRGQGDEEDRRGQGQGCKGAIRGAVVDIGSGKVLFAHKATRGYIPASTMKLLTTTAACRSWVPSTGSRPRWSAQGRSIILVGGGDPYLAQDRRARPGRASITDLARRAAEALKKKETRRSRSATTRRCSAARRGTGPGRRSTATR